MKPLFAALMLLLPTLALAKSSLSPQLSVFEPYLGTWQAQFQPAPAQEQVTDVSQWQRALNGTAIRTLHSINDGDYGGESLIFWDQSKQKLVFYYFTTASFYTQGWLEVGDDGSFTAYEEVTGSAQGITQIKSTSQFVDGKIVVSTQYLQNEQWTSPQIRTYTRSDKAVVFK
ncbi:hypothetical protein CWC31_12185 [Pseudoalteromonas ruthenica]|uniref:hypothetical protein n=1 Tax=Pseudoalteromonas ruthenica TaxID=151081 RepID=UPI001109DA29|nr:hypothetical protein CWC31_12185 [Pseudoalteromonas ruthenica]